MALISDVHSDVMHVVVEWLNFSDIFNLAATRDTRLLTRLVRSNVIKTLVIDQIPATDKAFQLWLLRNLNFLETVVFAEQTSAASVFIPVLATKNLKSVTIQSPLYDSLANMGLKHSARSLFSVVLIEPSLLPVPNLRPLFPSLLHLKLDIPVDKIFLNARVVLRVSRRAVHRAGKPNPYLELFRGLPPGLLSLEITDSSHEHAITAKSLDSLPTSLTKLKIHQTASSEPIPHNSLYLDSLRDACPTLGDLDINWTNLTRFSISREDRESKMPLGHIVLNPFSEYLVRLSLLLTRPRFSARLSFPESLRSLKLENPKFDTEQVLFGLENLLHPVLPQQLESLHLSGISLCFDSREVNTHDPKEGKSLSSLRLPGTLTSLTLDRYADIWPIDIHFPTLPSLRHLSFQRPYSNDNDSQHFFPIPAANMFQSHSLLRVELAPSIVIPFYAISAFPTQLRVLQAAPESVSVLLALIDRLPDCHFGSIVLSLTAGGLASLMERTVAYGFAKDMISPNSLLACLRAVVAPRCDRLALSFPHAKARSTNMLALVPKLAPAGPKEVKSLYFPQASSVVRSRTVSLNCSEFDPSFFTGCPNLVTMDFHTSINLTQNMFEALPRSLTHLNARKSPIESPLDFSVLPRSLTHLELDYNGFRVDGTCEIAIAGSMLHSLVIPFVHIPPPHLMRLMSLNMRELHFSTSAHDVDVARLVKLIPATANWSIRGYIHITGLLIAGDCRVVDYEIICQSALDVIDQTRKHTKDVTFRASPELVFPKNVKAASLVQKQLRGWAPSDDMLEVRLPSNIVGIGIDDAAATNDYTLNWLLDNNPKTLPQPQYSGGLSWVIGYALKRLHLEVVNRNVHLSDFVGVSLPKLRHLSLVGPMKGKGDIPHSLKSLVVDNTGKTDFLVELGDVPFTLKELELKANCTLKPPPTGWAHTLKRLSFGGGRPWTDAHALMLQQSLPRHAIIHIGTLGFSGALVSKGAEHLSWQIMVKDTLQGLARVTVSAFDLAITDPLPLLLDHCPKLRSLHLNPDDVSLHRSRRPPQPIAIDASTASADANRMDEDPAKYVAIDLDEAMDELPPLLNADQFPLRRMGALQASVQELQIDNYDDFFPTHLLKQIPHLRFSHLVRLVLNVPIQLPAAQSLGADLPRSLVTLSMPKASEQPPGSAIKLFDLPPSLMYLSVPKLLLDPPTVAYIPPCLVLLKAFNPAELSRALYASDPRLAAIIFPQNVGPPTTPSPSRASNQGNSSGSSKSSSRNGGSQKSSPTSPTTRKIRHVPVDAISLDDDDDILAPYNAHMPPPAKTPLNQTPTNKASPASPSYMSHISPTTRHTPKHSSSASALMIEDDDDDDVLSPLPFPGSRSRTNGDSAGPK